MIGYGGVPKVIFIMKIRDDVALSWPRSGFQGLQCSVNTITCCVDPSRTGERLACLSIGKAGIFIMRRSIPHSSFQGLHNCFYVGEIPSAGIQMLPMFLCYPEFAQLETFRVCVCGDNPVLHTTTFKLEWDLKTSHFGWNNLGSKADFGQDKGWIT